MRNIINVSIATLLVSLGLLEAQTPVNSPGYVRFVRRADSTLDSYTNTTDPVARQWFLDHWLRMIVFSPYFDNKLSWYPRANFYKDSSAIYNPGPIATAHPEWILRDGSNNKLYIPFGCSGGTCPQYAADYGNAAFRADWIASAATEMNLGYTGVWVDDVNMDFRVGDGNGVDVVPIDPRTGVAMTITNWRKYLAEFMEAVRTAFPNKEIVHNSLWHANSGVDSEQYIQRQYLAADTQNIECGAEDSGLTGGTGTFSLFNWLAHIDGIHAINRSVTIEGVASGCVSVPPPAFDITRAEYSLANYFLISNGADFIGNDGRNPLYPTNWWTGFDVRLGAATGPRTTWNTLYRRDFDGGMVLVNQPGASTVTATLPGPFKRLNGTVVTSVSIPARSGVVLTSVTPATISVAPGCNLQTLINNANIGDILQFSAGTFRDLCATGVPKDFQTFKGTLDASGNKQTVLNGSTVLSGYTQTSVPIGGGGTPTPKVFNPANYSMSNTRYVNGSTGNDSNNGLTPTSAWRTIQKAVDTSPSSTLVRIAGGIEYTNQRPTISGKSNIALVGDTQDPTQRPFINTTSSGIDQVVFIQDSNNITLDNLKIRGFNVGNRHGSPVFLKQTGGGSTHHVTFRNLDIEAPASAGNGFHIYGGDGGPVLDYITIEDCVVHGIPGQEPGGWRNDQGPSGISVFQPKQMDTASGPHMIFRRNLIYHFGQGHISNGLPDGHGGFLNFVTDGNGILLCDGCNQSGYTARMEAYDNIVIFTGGDAITAYDSSGPFIVYNNTTYKPGRCRLMSGAGGDGMVNCSATSEVGTGTGAGYDGNNANGGVVFNNTFIGPGSGKWSSPGTNGTCSANFNHSFNVTGNSCTGANNRTGDPQLAAASITSTNPLDWVPATTSPLVQGGTASFNGTSSPAVDYDNQAQSVPPTMGAQTAGGSILLWTMTGQTQQGTPSALTCLTGVDCNAPEDLFFIAANGAVTPKTHVTSIANAGVPGAWFFDYAADKIYWFDNPAGVSVETSVRRNAFSGSATGVTVQNMTLEKYSTPANVGTIGDSAPTSGWTVDNVETRYVHGAPVNAGPSWTVKKLYSHDNGQLNARAGAFSGILFDRVELANFRNYAGFSLSGDAGGAKFFGSSGLRFLNSYVHDNLGPGVWFSSDSTSVEVGYSNFVKNSTGILHEISNSGRHHHNTFIDNGDTASRTTSSGGCVTVSTAMNVEVDHNLCRVQVSGSGNGWNAVQNNRGSGAFGAYRVSNLNVHDNEQYIVGSVACTGLSNGTVNGIFQDFTGNGDAYALSSNNRFQGNTYHYLAPASACVNYWSGTLINFFAWKSFGQDTSGNLDSNTAGLVPGDNKGDACLTPQPQVSLAVGQFGIPVNYSGVIAGSQGHYGSGYSRPITRASMRYRSGTPTQTARSFFDSSWLLFTDHRDRLDLMAVQLPPTPAVDVVKRDTFVDLPVALKPPSALGASTAAIYFGYNASLYCQGQEVNFQWVGRSESCVSTNTSSTWNVNDPYWFSGETFTRTSCASGCTIHVPARSGQVVFYQHRYYDSGGSEIARSQTYANAVH